MNHYFIYDKNQKEELRQISFSIDGVDINLVSDANTFSNKRLDEGTKVLLKYLSSINLKGSLLDLGCGYGPVGVTLKLLYKDLDVTMADINKRCVNLAQENAKTYHLDIACIESDSYSNIDNHFDIVTLNPPISCGKEQIFKMYQETKNHLNDNGAFYIVIRKDKGALSHQKYLFSLFPSVNVIYKEKGYYIFKAK